MDKMTLTQFNKAVTEARYIFTWSIVTDNDGKYLEVKKGSIRQYIRDLRQSDKNIKVNAVLRDCGDLYIG